MRTAPIYLEAEQLEHIDENLRIAISSACNVDLRGNHWIQASLPTRMGGIGARRLVDVALPAHIASLEATRELVNLINPCISSDRSNTLVIAIDRFVNAMCPSFDSNESLKQRHLDERASFVRFQQLVNESNQLDCARLLAAAAPHTGAWLSAIPVACLGLLLPDDAVRVGVALRLGCAI